MIAAWAAVGVNLALAIFIYGGLHATVKNHEKRLDAHDVEQERQWRDIAIAQSSLARVEGMLNGKARGAHGL